MRKRLDTGPIQRQKQAIAPQPDRDFPRATQPQTTVQLNTPRVVPGGGAYEPTGGYTPPVPSGPQPLPQVGGGEARPVGQGFYDLKNRYENRLAAGGGGQQFLDRHPRFADRYSRSVVAPSDPNRPRTTGPQGNSVQPIGWSPSQPGRNGQGFAPAAPGQTAPVAPGTVVTGGGMQVYTQPPPGSAMRPDGSIDLPTGWAGIGGPDGNLVYVQGWNQLTHEQQIQLISEIKGQDWITPNGGVLQDYGPGIAATGQMYGDQGYAVAPAPAQEVVPHPAARVIPGTPEPGMPGPVVPQPQQIGNGFTPQPIVNPDLTGQGYNYAQLNDMYQALPPGERRRFLEAHPRFANNLRGGTQNNQGNNGVINGGVGGALPGPGQGGGGNGGGVAQPNPNPAPSGNSAASTLTLSPAAEAARRGLEDELAATLASIGVARDQIPATLNLITTRLLNDQSEDLRNTDEAANARGIYDSGIRSTDRGRVTSGYDRKRADIAADAARQLSELAAAESGALAGFNRSWADILLDLAAAAAEDPDYGSGSSKGNTYGNSGASSGKGPKPKTQGKNRRNDDKKKPRKRGNR